MRIAVFVSLLFILMASAVAETVPPPSPLDAAKALISQDKQIEAIPILEKIVASDPDSAPHALDMMVGCYDALEEWGKAIGFLEELLTLHPNSDGEIKRRMMDYYLADGKFEEYRSLRRELVSEYQSDAWKLYYTVGRRRVLRHEYSEAIPELKKAIELGAPVKSNLDIIDANYRLLHCYVVKKQWDEAEELGPKLVETYPEVAYKFQMEMGKCYQVQGKCDKAIDYLEPAAEKCPKDFDNAKRLYKTLLDAYDRIRKYDKAIALGKKLVEEYPDEPGYKWELGRSYMYVQKYDTAAFLFQRVVETSHAEWEIRSSQIYLAQCFSNLGKGEEALVRIEAFYKDKPELWDSFLLAKAAVLFYGVKDNVRCLENVKELLAQVAAGKESDLVPTARELMYKSYEKMEKWTEAASVLEEMKSPIYLSRAGDDYLEAGNYAEAKRVYKGVLDRPDATDDIRAACMYGLALCYRETGLKDAAKRMMQTLCKEYPRTEGGMKAEGLLYLWTHY